MTSTLPQLDEEILAGIWMLADDDDMSFVIDFFQSYWKSHAELRENLDQALAAGDSKEILRLAHTLKGSSANVGAKALSGYYRSIEDACREGRLDGFDETLARASEEFARFRAELDRRLSQPV